MANVARSESGWPPLEMSFKRVTAASLVVPPSADRPRRQLKRQDKDYPWVKDAASVPAGPSFLIAKSGPADAMDTFMSACGLSSLPAATPQPKAASAPKEPVEEDKPLDIDSALATLKAETISKKHIFVTSAPGVGKTTFVRKLLEKLLDEEGDGGIDAVGFYTEEVRDSAGKRAGFDVVRVGGGRPEMSHRCALARHGTAHPKVGKYTVDIVAFEAFALQLLEPPDPPAPPLEIPANPRLHTLPDNTVELVSLLEELPVEAEGESEIRPCTIKFAKSGASSTVDASTLVPLPDGWRPEEPKRSEDKPRPRLCLCDEAGKMELMSVQFGPSLVAALDHNPNSYASVVLGTIPEASKGQRDHELIEQIRRRKDVHIVRITRNNRDSLVDREYATLRQSLSLGPPGTGVHIAAKKPSGAGETLTVKEKEILQEWKEDKAAERAAPKESPSPEGDALPNGSPAQEDEATKKKKKKDKDKKKEKKKEKEKKSGMTQQEAQERIEARKRKREAAANAVPLSEDDDVEVSMVTTLPSRVLAPVQPLPRPPVVDEVVCIE